MKKALPVFLFFYSILLTTSVNGQKYSNEFLSIGLGARAQAMGNAVVASQEDVMSIYWNPASLVHTQAEGLQIGALHNEWFAGIGKYDYLGFSIPLKNREARLGFGLIRFGIDGIPNTLSLYEDDGSINYNSIVEFSAADYAIYSSYSQKTNLLDGQLSWGLNAKIVRRVIGSFANSWGFGLDLGARWTKNQWRAGLLLRDISTTVNAWSVNFTEEEKDILLVSGNSLPDINSTEITKPSILLGFGRYLNLNQFSIYPEINLFVTTDGQRNTLVSSDPVSMDIGFGLECIYKGVVFLRTGIHQFQYVQDFDLSEKLSVKPSAGVGFKISGFSVDYAFTTLGSGNDQPSHVFSLMYNLNK